MREQTKADTLKRLNYIEGHLKGIRRMIEQDEYCVDILNQTLAVRRAIEKLETIILDSHMRSCVPAGIKGDREKEVIDELIELFRLNNTRIGSESDDNRNETA